MINSILLSVLIVAGIGLIIGIILAVTSIIFKVPTDEKAEEILEALPGANCGACGFSGCAGYAKALSKGTAKSGLCPVGGTDCAHKINSILGLGDTEMEKKVATVRCRGSYDNTENKAEYFGIDSCTAAAKVGQGFTKCSFGCLGFGDCEKICSFGAISVCNGVAVVNKDICKSCGMCIITCPRKLITLVPYKNVANVTCMSQDKGGVARKNCTSACIGCQKCVKVCEEGAVTVNNFLATVDYTKCTGCGKCVESCPTHAISLIK